ncbi:unnamed protein product [Lactuca virosa]|uniref:RNase H type-1 domain-containing protein n=1 Tax=Lactuca virosa TaxID=75947 RepID=A0AAU9LSI2_9ASTR|nr:unnamed protein product [Lactuca virosa]
MDGDASKEGSGAGLILTNPEDNKVTHALRFDFETSNNKVEYEALLSRLRIACKMEVKNLRVMNDSMLVTKKVNGTYDMKNTRMKKYVADVSEMAASFESLIVEQIKRRENRCTDALIKLVATTYSHFSKKVLLEILSSRIIDES